MNLNAFDLNLLRVFHALLEEGNVTRAGQRIGLTQSAMSSALKRLRSAFDDELFVRGPGGMQPTPRALALAEPISKIMETVASSVIDGARFDPSTSNMRFGIGLTDYAAFVVLPKLMSVLSRHAPDISLDVVRIQEREDAIAVLDSGAADITVSVSPRLPGRLSSEHLFEESFTCLMCSEHLSESQMSLETFTRQPHVLVSLTGDRTGFVDLELKKRDLDRFVRLTLPQFLAVPEIVRTGSAIATLPSRIAARFSANDPLLVEAAPPIELPTFSMSLIWHKRSSESDAHLWLRKQVLDACRTPQS